jgi:hypothetical protein
MPNQNEEMLACPPMMTITTKELWKEGIISSDVLISLSTFNNHVATAREGYLLWIWNPKRRPPRFLGVLNVNTEKLFMHAKKNKKKHERGCLDLTLVYNFCEGKVSNNSALTKHKMSHH